MICQRIVPPPPVNEYVKEYLLLHMKFGEGVTAPVKAYPVNPEEGMTCVIRGVKTVENVEAGTFEVRPRTYLFGLPNVRQNFHLALPEYLMVHVRFQVGAMHKLFRIPMYEMLHQYIEAKDIAGTAITEVEDRLDNASTYDELPLILNQFFAKKIAQIKYGFEPIDRIGRMIVTNPQGFQLAKTADAACLSIRQFEKRFERQIGVTPKYYARICRFYQAYELKERQPNLDWLSVALYNGYTDYQHLVKDFKRFAGVTPNALIQESHLNPERRLGLNHEFVGV